MKKLCAEQELRLPGLAREGYYYLRMKGYGTSPQEKESLWAVANNAALLCLASQKESTPFYSVQQVLKQRSLQEIADFAQRYQEVFEE